MEEISSYFRASLNRGNAARIQHFDISFEQDLSPAFQNIFPIENRIILVEDNVILYHSIQGKVNV